MTNNSILRLIGPKAVATLILSGSCLLSSCLSEHPKDQLTEDEAYSSASSLYVNTVATLYNYIGGSSDSQGLQGTYRGVYDYNTFTTDEAMLPTRGGDWYDGGFWQNLYLHTWTSSDRPLADTWNYLYKVVTLCNRSLARLEEHQELLSASEMQLYTAEVRAIRAMYYYYLMDMFGRIPLVTSEDTPLSSVRQAERSTVFAFIVDELQETEQLLPMERSNTEGKWYGRVTRPVVQFLLAKLMLNAGVYTETENLQPTAAQLEACISYCDLLAEEGYRLETDYVQNFSVNNENSQENIFTIPMDKTLYGNVFKNLFRSRHYNHGAALGMDAENGSCATRAAIDTYGYGTPTQDSRFDWNFYHGTVIVDGNTVYLDNGQPLVYVPEVVQLDLTGSAYEKTAGARMAKYEIDRTAYSDGLLQSNDIVLFRYADVLLMKAEAKARLGMDGSEELNAVRSRAGMYAREATLDNILDERLMELHWEGWRRQDLIRFGKFHKAYDQRPQADGESDGHTILFPIPDGALSLNANLSQNSGY